MRAQSLILWTSLVAGTPAAVPPGQFVYGFPEDVGLIQQRLLTGTIADVVAAVDAAKQHRGEWVGCPESAYTWQAASDGAPSSSQIRDHWQSVAGAHLASVDVSFPSAARRWAYAALGGLAAQQAGLPVDAVKLRAIADLASSIQYTDANAPWPPQRTPGLYGYVVVSATDPWFDLTPASGSTVGQNLLDLQAAWPALIATYDAGPWAGRSFVIADVSLPSFIDAGANYDHGIAGVMMVESAIQEADPAARQQRWSSARLAADWAIAEPPVVNANYTAKLIWLLAHCYAVSGLPSDRLALMDKIDRAVLPGILMDANADGLVDGMVAQPFSELATVAQVPGRMWDGHNARPVYHAMISQAMTTAYAALRDRGDAAEAARIRPAVIALLDNLAAEVNALGVPSQGKGLVPLALLAGCWSIGQAEGLSFLSWWQAIARCWNAGCFANPQESAAATGLYALAVSGKPYTTAEARWTATSAGGSGSGESGTTGNAGGGSGGGCGAGTAISLLACAIFSLAASAAQRCRQHS